MDEDYYDYESLNWKDYARIIIVVLALILIALG